MKTLKTHCSWCSRIYNPALDEWERSVLPLEGVTSAACPACLESDPRLELYRQIKETNRIRQRAA